MNAIPMRLGLGILLVFQLTMGIQAQDPRFIYIQSEIKQPFFVKINQTFLNSSATGYLIIPRLVESNYKIAIGFPGNQWPEREVYVPAGVPGTGYLLKTEGDSSWRLIPLETERKIIATESTPAEKLSDTIVFGGEFARILAEVVNDPSIAQKIIVRPRPNETVRVFPDKSGIVENEKTIVTATAVNNDVKNFTPDSNSAAIRKLHGDGLANGMALTYLDETIKPADTVKVFITVEEEKGSIQPMVAVAPALSAVDSAVKDRRFIDMQLQNPNTPLDSGAVAQGDFVIREKKKDIIANAEAGKNEKNSDAGKLKSEAVCIEVATENDFFLLRKKMILRNNDEEMITTAVTQFKEMCFTTGQVKNLGVLFLGDKERVGFYQAIYPYVSDAENFSSLESQLTDAVAKARFATILKQ